MRCCNILKNVGGTHGKLQRGVQEDQRSKVEAEVIKSSFAQYEVKLLGHIANSGGVEIDGDKVKDVVEEAPLSANLTEIRVL